MGLVTRIGSLTRIGVACASLVPQLAALEADARAQPGQAPSKSYSPVPALASEVPPTAPEDGAGADADTGAGGSAAPDAQERSVAPRPEVGPSAGTDRAGHGATSPQAQDPEEPATRPKVGPSGEVDTNEVVYATQVAQSADPRSSASDWLIAPADTMRLGVENILVTADGDLTPLLGTRQLALTDLALVQLFAGYSVAGTIEVFGSSTLLPKQPVMSDASVFQGASLGARVGLAPAVALTLVGRGGPTIATPGKWLDAALTLDGRYEADRYLIFDGRVGVGGTGISQADKRAGLAEALAAVDVVLQHPGEAAITTGISFAFPFLTGDESPLSLEPQTRVQVHATGTIALADEWDVWLRAAVIDRGELNVPESVLPILDGGFDQRQFTLGISYRSENREPSFSFQ